MTLKQLLATVLLGVAPLTYTAWSWLGISRTARWWVASSGMRRLVLIVLPGWGIVVIAVGIDAVSADTSFESVGETVTLALVLTGLLLVGWGALFLPIPNWWGPRWFKDLDAPSGVPKVSSAFGALTSGHRHDVPISSNDIVARASQGEEVIGSWRGSFVFDPDTLEREHGLSGRGSVAGRLSASASGLSFAATPTEDALRGKSTVWRLDRRQFVRARDVPARAGADGVARRGWMYRSVFRRLVIDAVDQSYVFDVFRASKVAGLLNRLYDEDET